MTAYIINGFDDGGDPSGFTNEALKNFGIQIEEPKQAKDLYSATRFSIVGIDDGGDPSAYDRKLVEKHVMAAKPVKPASSLTL